MALVPALVRFQPPSTNYEQHQMILYPLAVGIALALWLWQEDIAFDKWKNDPARPWNVQIRAMEEAIDLSRHLGGHDS